MRKLTVTEPETDTLEISFDMLGKEGADRLAQTGGRKPKAARRLQQVFISPCAATELKASPLSPSCLSSSGAVASHGAVKSAQPPDQGQMQACGTYGTRQRGADEQGVTGSDTMLISNCCGCRVL